MKKIIWGVVILAVVAVFGGRAWYLHTQKQAENTNEKTIRIGAILPLTSGMSKTGYEILESLKIAEQNINSNPKYNFKVKLLVEDGKFEPKTTVSAFQKLVSQDMDALIVFADIPAKALTKFVQERKMPTLIIGGMTGYYTLSPYMFKVPISNDTFSAQLVKYMTTYEDIQNVGITYMDAFGQKEGVQFLEQELKKQGRNVTSIEKFKENALGAKDHVLKMQNQDPDAVIVFAYGDGAYPATINYFREYGYTKPIFSLFALPAVLHRLKDTSNIYFVDTALQNDAETSNFRKRFGEKFGGAEPDSFSVFSYTAENMIAKVASKVGIDNPDLFMKELKSTPYFDTPYGKLEIIGEETYVPVFVKKISSDGTIEIVNFGEKEK